VEKAQAAAPNTRTLLEQHYVSPEIAKFWVFDELLDHPISNFDIQQREKSKIEKLDEYSEFK
jgi:hypothetical protein